MGKITPNWYLKGLSRFANDRNDDNEKIIFNNEYLILAETNNFKRQGKTYIDLYWEYRNLAEEYAKELREYKYISVHQFDKSTLQTMISDDIRFSKYEISALLNEAFQLFLEDLQGMENNNQTQEILTAKFIDACGELKQREFLTKDIYLDFLKRGDMFSDCGDNVRVGINKEFLENICKKLFD